MDVRRTRPLSRLAGTVLALTLAAAGPTVVTAPATAADTGTRAAADTYELRVQRWINVRRAEHGLPRLRTARCADRVAAEWSRHLVRTDGFHHRDMRVVLDRCDATWAGETLGRGALTPKRLVRMWMQSPGHRAILLAEQPGHVGIGAVRDGGQWLTTANFVRR